jgi:hypothetical protein
MFMAYVALSIPLAAALVLAGTATVKRNEQIVRATRRVGVPEGWLPWLSAAQLAGAAGLLAGIVVAPVGIAAAAGVVLYFLGAVGSHLRAKDLKGLGSPTTLLTFAIAALIVRTGSLG